MELTTLHMGLDKNDVIAVSVANAERQFTANLEDAKKRLKSLEKHKKDQEAQLHEEYQKSAGAMTKHLTEANAMLSQMFSLDLSFTVDQSGDTRMVHLTLRNSAGYTSVIGKGVPIVSTEAITKLKEELNATKAIIDTTAAEALEYRTKLNKIPQLERQVRGQLAEAQLRKSAEGLAILDNLTNTLPAQMLALPTS